MTQRKNKNKKGGGKGKSWIRKTNIKKKKSPSPSHRRPRHVPIRPYRLNEIRESVRLRCFTVGMVVRLPMSQYLRSRYPQWWTSCETCCLLPGQPVSNAFLRTSAWGDDGTMAAVPRAISTFPFSLFLQSYASFTFPLFSHPLTP